MDPHSNLRVGPSAAATIAFAFFSLAAVKYMVDFGRHASESGVSVVDRVTLALGVAAHGFAVYLYYAHYRQCRPWMGWVLFIIVGSCIAALVPPAALPGRKDEEEHPWVLSVK